MTTSGFDRGVTVIGRPASYARFLARRAYLQAAGLSLPALLCAGLSWLLFPAWPAWLAVLVMCVLFAAASTRVDAARKAMVGVHAEEAVVRAVKKSKAANVILNGLLLGAGGDADHVLLGPIAAVVETKAGFKRLSVRDGAVYSGERKVGKDPVGQVGRQAAALERLLGVSVTRIVCVPGATGPVQRAGRTVVCNAENLPKVLGQCPNVLASVHVPAAVTRLQDVDRKLSEKQEK